MNISVDHDQYCLLPKPSCLRSAFSFLEPVFLLSDSLLILASFNWTYIGLMTVSSPRIWSREKDNLSF